MVLLTIQKNISKIVFIDEFGVKRYSDKTILEFKNNNISTRIIQYFDITCNSIKTDKKRIY